MITIKQALERVRAAWEPNSATLEDIKDRFQNVRQPIPLLPFVGAGASIPLGFPTWAKFLMGLAVECGKSAEVEALLNGGEYEAAAELVEDGLSATIFNARVSHIFGDRKSNECDLTDAAVLALPAVAAGSAVVTTNFDRVLERVFSEAGEPFSHVAWGSQVDAIQSAVSTNRPFLLKIHGDAEERAGRVLTKREYDRAYGLSNPEGLRALLGRVFQGRTVLFIGCSLTTDRTLGVLVEILRQASGMSHYAILPKPKDDGEFYMRQRFLGEHGIRPIWYPDGEHELLAPLLWWFAGLSGLRP